MCGETQYFTHCPHQTEVFVACSWNEERYHRYRSPSIEGFCRSCHRDELTNTLTGHCPNPREAAANMLNAINETRDAPLTTPARVVSYFKKSKYAKPALERMMAPQDVDWLPGWLWAGSVTEGQEKCVKKRKKKMSPPYIAGGRELSSYRKIGTALNSAKNDTSTLDHSLHLGRGLDLDWTSFVDSRPRRPQRKGAQALFR